MFIEADPAVNRQWRFRGGLTGALEPRHFERVASTPPPLRQGQARVALRLISVDPANRLYLAMQAYRPQVMPGEVMAGFGIGEIVESTDPRFRPGDRWHGDFGWQDLAVINSYDRQEYFYRCPPGTSDSDELGVLGITGLTAWFGVQTVLKPQPGETAVVAGATGACGSIIAQLLRLAGARVIGLGGGPQKCRWLTETLGLDAAVDHRSPDAAAVLQQLCPDGVQMFSDGVGAPPGDAVPGMMRRGGRWYHYGNMAAYDSVLPDQPAPRHDVVADPALRVHCAAEGLRPQFLMVFDHYAQRHAARAALSDLLAAGRLQAPVTELTGLDALPDALITGGGAKRIGKLNVRP